MSPYGKRHSVAVSWSFSINGLQYLYFYLFVASRIPDFDASVDWPLVCWNLYHGTGRLSPEMLNVCLVRYLTAAARQAGITYGGHPSIHPASIVHPTICLIIHPWTRWFRQATQRAAVGQQAMRVRRRGGPACGPSSRAVPAGVSRP